MWCKNAKYGRPASFERFDQNSELKKLVYTPKKENHVIDELFQNERPEDKFYFNWLGCGGGSTVKITKYLEDESELKWFFEELLRILDIPGFKMKHSLKVGFSWVVCTQNGRNVFLPCKRDPTFDWCFQSEFLRKQDLIDLLKSEKIDEIDGIWKYYVNRFQVNNDFQTQDICEKKPIIHVEVLQK